MYGHHVFGEGVEVGDALAVVRQGKGIGRRVKGEAVGLILPKVRLRQRLLRLLVVVSVDDGEPLDAAHPAGRKPIVGGAAVKGHLPVMAVSTPDNGEVRLEFPVGFQRDLPLGKKRRTAHAVHPVVFIRQADPVAVDKADTCGGGAYGENCVQVFFLYKAPCRLPGVDRPVEGVCAPHHQGGRQSQGCQPHPHFPPLTVLHGVFLPFVKGASAPVLQSVSK